MSLPHGCPKEKPISEELEEAAWLYYDKNRLSIPPECDLHKEFIDFFKAGAQWQKSKDESSTEDLEEVSKKYSSCIYLEEVLSDDDKEVLKARLMNTFKSGAKWQKEQMIDKACKWLKENKDHPLIGCEDPCLSGYLTDGFIEDFKKAMEE